MNTPVIEGQATELTEVVESVLPRIAPSDMDASLAVQLSQAEIDQQIATARKWPRSIDNAIKTITQLATYDPETAQECIYALPRGKGANAKTIEGPSIRLAELIAQQWGNNRCDARVVHVDRKEKYIEAEGVYHDLETNTAVRSKVRRRISDSRGNLYNDDMIIVTGNAACSIALRNAILRGVPKPIWRRAYEKAVGVVRGDERTLQARRGQLLDSFEVLGVTAAQVYAIAGVAGPHDVGLDQIVYLAGVYSAIKNNEVTVEDLLQERKAMTPTPKGLGAGFGDEGKAAPAETEGKPPADKKPSKADQRQEQVKADRKAALHKAVTLGEEAEEAALNGDGTLDDFLSRAETDEERDFVRNGWAKGEAERAKDQQDAAEREGFGQDDDTAAQIPADDAADQDEDEADTTAPAGVPYLIIGEGYDEDGRRPSYQDGKPFSRVTEKGAAKLTAYDHHAPTVEAEGEATDGGEPGKPTDPTTQSQPSSDASPTTPAGDLLDSVKKVDQQFAAGSDNPFTKFEETVAESATWDEVKAALTALSQSPGWPEADDEAKRMARLGAIEQYDDLVANGGQAEVKLTEDLQLFRCWIEKTDLTGPDIQKVWRDVIRSTAYGQLPEESKDALGAAVAARKESAS